MGKRTIISRELLDRAVGLLRDGLSASQTAKRLDLGESVVRRIARGKHALQRPGSKKRKKWRNRYGKIFRPTPEEIEARAWAVRMGRTEAQERRSEGGTPEPFECETLPDSIFGVDVPPEVRT